MSEPQYLSLTEISVYSKASRERLNNPKENFKLVAALIAAIHPREADIAIADIGCANGELLYFLRSVFPNARLTGYDREPKFLEVARSLNLPNTHFEEGDLREIRPAELFDCVVCLGTVPIFQDPAEVMHPLLSMVKPGGLLLADGLFNRHECEVRVSFCDNSTSAGKGLWRIDFAQHSRTRIRTLLEPLCSRVEFHDNEMGVDIPKRDDRPHVNVWTFKDESGRRHQTNGLNLLLDDTIVAATRR
jgi:trans-aconitate methyltransferase